MVNQNKEYYLGLYEKSMPNTLSWEEKLKVVKEAGFDYLEMSIDETEEKLARLDQMCIRDSHYTLDVLPF